MTRKWWILIGAILAEVSGAMALKAAMVHPAWIAITILGFAGAFTALALLLRAGEAIGAIYAVWAASGVALTALLGALLFGEHLPLLSIAGIAVVIIGVVLVETGHPTTPAQEEATR